MSAPVRFALVTGALLLPCWLLFPPAKAVAGCVFVLGLAGASFIDLRQMIIPDLFSIGLAAAGLALSAAVPALHGCGPFLLVNCARSAAAGLLGLGIGSAFVLWLGLIGEILLRREVLGFGDVKFVGAIGAFCGWQGAVFSIFGGALVGAIVLLAAAAWDTFAPGRPALRGFEGFMRLESPDGQQAARLGWTVRFPFGPMLACAAALYFLALHPWVDRFLAQYLLLF